MTRTDPWEITDEDAAEADRRARRREDPFRFEAFNRALMEEAVAIVRGRIDPEWQDEDRTYTNIERVMDTRIDFSTKEGPWA